MNRRRWRTHQCLEPDIDEQIYKLSGHWRANIKDFCFNTSYNYDILITYFYNFGLISLGNDRSIQFQYFEWCVQKYKLPDTVIRVYRHLHTRSIWYTSREVYFEYANRHNSEHAWRKRLGLVALSSAPKIEQSIIHISLRIRNLFYL